MTEERWRQLWDAVYYRFSGYKLTPEQAKELLQWAQFKAEEAARPHPPDDLPPLDISAPVRS